MDKQAIKENILRQLELITEQNNNLNTYALKIPQIDLDILKSSVRKLYEQIYELEKIQLHDIKTQLHADVKTNEVIEEIVETPENPLVIINENTEVSEPEEELTVKDENQEDEVENIEVIFTPEPKAVIEEKVIEIKEETIKETIKQEKQKTIKPPDLFGNTGNTIADKYRTEDKSINEKINKTKIDKTLASRMLHNPIKDLKAAIGINEKFLFINELFKGNMKKYNDSIIALNTCETPESAFAILDSLKIELMWEDDMVAFLTLKDFVERKYIR